MATDAVLFSNMIRIINLQIVCFTPELPCSYQLQTRTETVHLLFMIKHIPVQISKQKELRILIHMQLGAGSGAKAGASCDRAVMTAAARRLRILNLHSFRTSAAIFKEQVVADPTMRSLTPLA